MIQKGLYQCPTFAKIFNDKTIYIFPFVMFLYVAMENVKYLYISFMIFFTFLVIIFAIKILKKVTN